MINKYLIKPRANEQGVGVMHFCEQGRLKIGGNKSATPLIEYLYNFILGVEAKDMFSVGNGKVVYIHDAKSTDELNLKMDTAMESLAGNGWYIYRPSSLGRIMR